MGFFKGMEKRNKKVASCGICIGGCNYYPDSCQGKEDLFNLLLDARTEEHLETIKLSFYSTGEEFSILLEFIKFLRRQKLLPEIKADGGFFQR